MFKIGSIAVVLGFVVLTVSQDASAGWRRCPRYETVWYSPPAAAMTAPAAVTPVPTTAQSSNGSSYRSYSYDPTPAYGVTAPSAYTQPTPAPSESRFFRADRKAHGLSWYRNQ